MSTVPSPPPPPPPRPAPGRASRPPPCQRSRLPSSRNPVSRLEGAKIGERLRREDAGRSLGGDRTRQKLLHPQDHVARGAVAEQRKAERRDTRDARVRATQRGPEPVRRRPDR